MKRAERRYARAAEQVFRSLEVMPSILVAEPESRVMRNFGAKDMVHEPLDVTMSDGY